MAGRPAAASHRLPPGPVAAGGRGPAQRPRLANMVARKEPERQQPPQIKKNTSPPGCSRDAHQGGGRPGSAPRSPPLPGPQPRHSHCSALVDMLPPGGSRSAPSTSLPPAAAPRLRAGLGLELLPQGCGAGSGGGRSRGGSGALKEARDAAASPRSEAPEPGNAVPEGPGGVEEPPREAAGCPRRALRAPRGSAAEPGHGQSPEVAAGGGDMAGIC